MDISSNAVRNDGVQIKFIRIVFTEIQYVLCHILNFASINCVYTSQWKEALVLPFPKVKIPNECVCFSQTAIYSHNADRSSFMQ